MRRNSRNSGAVAFERLERMKEEEISSCTPEQMVQMRRELAAIIEKYYDVNPKLYEIRVLVKRKKRV